jgi:hypothetical protein
MDELRAEQAKGKGGREKTLEKLKQMQDALKRKVRSVLRYRHFQASLTFVRPVRRSTT